MPLCKVWEICLFLASKHCITFFSLFCLFCLFFYLLWNMNMFFCVAYKGIFISLSVECKIQWAFTKLFYLTLGPKDVKQTQFLHPFTHWPMANKRAHTALTVNYREAANHFPICSSVTQTFSSFSVWKLGGIGASTL